MRKSRKLTKASVFDRFFRKAGFKSVRVFLRFKDSLHCFGLNVIAQKRISPTDTAMYHDDSLYEYALEDSARGPLSDFMTKTKINKSRFNNNVYHKEFSIKDLPKKFKEAVIDHCIEKHKPIFIDKSVFIPAARSLEELMIDLELERDNEI